VLINKGSTVITLIAKLLKVLNSQDSPTQISLALVFALLIGLTPLNSPHNLLLLFLVLILRVNLTMFLLGMAVFTLFAYLLDPISNMIGLYLLELPTLNGLWTAFYNNTLMRLIGFNNTLLLGSLSLALIISIPLFFVARSAVINYREYIMSWVKKSRIALWFKSGKIYSAYSQFSS